MEQVGVRLYRDRSLRNRWVLLQTVQRKVIMKQVWVRQRQYRDRSLRTKFYRVYRITLTTGPTGRASGTWI